MPPFLSFRMLRRAIVSLTLVALVFQSLGCGTLLHPDRVGQPHSGRIDPAIAVLDGVGLLLFIVPGVVSFIVDFATGAIYLPYESYGQNENGQLDPSQCEKIPVPPGELTTEKLEQVLSERTGHSVTLAPGSYEVRPLESEEKDKVTVLGQSE